MFDFSSIEQYVEKLIKDESNPGLALAVVKEDKVIFSRGFGSANINYSQILPVEAGATRSLSYFVLFKVSSL